MFLLLTYATCEHTQLPISTKLGSLGTPLQLEYDLYVPGGRRHINAGFLSIGFQIPEGHSLVRRATGARYLVGSNLNPPTLIVNSTLHVADPFSLATEVISLLTLAINLVAGTAGLIDKTIAAHREAASELEALEWDLRRLER